LVEQDSEQDSAEQDLAMCDECEEFPAQYVAYFNKAGGKLWRPARKAATAPWAIDIRPQESVPVVLREVRQFTCDDPSAPGAPAAQEVV
jgi:hypothetical protein